MARTKELARYSTNYTTCHRSSIIEEETACVNVPATGGVRRTYLRRSNYNSTKTESSPSEYDQELQNSNEQIFILTPGYLEYEQTQTTEMIAEEDIQCCHYCLALLNGKGKLVNQFVPGELLANEDTTAVADEFKESEQEFTALKALPANRNIWICEFCEALNSFDKKLKINDF